MSTGLPIRPNWARQPSSVVRINTSHPLSQGLVSCFGLAAYTGHDTVSDQMVLSRRWALVNTDQGTVDTPHGRGLRFVLASQNHYTAALSPLVPKSGFTALFFYRPNVGSAAAGRAIMSFTDTSVTHSFLQVSQETATGIRINFTDASATSAQATIAGALTTGNTYLVAVWSNGTNDHGVRYGLQRTSFSSTNTSLGAVNTPNCFTMGALKRTTTSNYGDGVLVGPWLYDRVLTHRDQDRFWLSPWAMFMPPRGARIFGWGLPAGGSKTTKLTLLGVG